MDLQYAIYWIFVYGYTIEKENFQVMQSLSPTKNESKTYIKGKDTFSEHCPMWQMKIISWLSQPS